MILVSHPTGNQNVRAVLSGLDKARRLEGFFTTLSFRQKSGFLRCLPSGLRMELARREYSIPNGKIVTFPIRETMRLISQKMGWKSWYRPGGPFSVDAIYRHLDQQTASYVRSSDRPHDLTGVYAYEDGAWHTFQAAREEGLSCIYDLPIAYWQTVQSLLQEEAERWPQWASTMGLGNDSAEKLERKTQELELAHAVVCPSQFVLNSLPAHIRSEKKWIVAEFGSPRLTSQSIAARPRRNDKTLRVLFAGSMSQRKGLADLFAAFRLLKGVKAQLVVLGQPTLDLSFYRQEYPDFIYEKPRPHAEVLKLMTTCDVLALPSLAEGRALVQQEAMACGLPLIVTPNAGGEDLIEEGKTGFLVPIRSPQILAERITYLAEHPEQVVEMGRLAQAKAQQITWENYSAKVVHLIRSLPASP